MSYANTTRWVTAGAVFGLSAAVFTDVAFAATPGLIARPNGSQSGSQSIAGALAAVRGADTAVTTPPRRPHPAATPQRAPRCLRGPPR